MKPMLAHRFQDKLKHIKYPCYLQPKLNGVRLIYRDDRFQSRDECFWSPKVLEHLRSELSNISPDFILDGELYRHNWSLQKINSAISINRREPKETTHEIEYHVFDLIYLPDPGLPFLDRLSLLSTLVRPEWTSVRRVPSTLCTTRTEAEVTFACHKDSGYEGSMYRDPSSPYGLAHLCSNQENRWTCLLKRKDWLDLNCEILSINEGEGKYSGLVGSLTLTTPEGVQFDAGSGLSDMQRHEFWRDPPIGQIARIKFEMYSDDGTPLKPTIEAILE